jgi:tetratricopeptide (TPR) repeat protein
MFFSNNLFRGGILGLTVIWASMAHATGNSAMDADVRHVDDQWAHITYQITDKDEQLRKIDALAQDAAAVVQKYPGQVKPLLWQGIVVSEEATMASVFDQLGLAKTARRIFEQAQSIDPNDPSGAVAMSLGVLYYHVPGFPIAFGDDKKARALLQFALSKDPDGLDANFFYGDFLLSHNDYAEAQRTLVHALAAPINPARPVWQAGRRAEVAALIAKIAHHTSEIASTSP